MAAWEIGRGEYFSIFASQKIWGRKCDESTAFWGNSIFPGLFDRSSIFHIWIKRTWGKMAIKWMSSIATKMFMTLWRLELKEKNTKIIQQLHQDGLDALSFWDCLLHLGKKRNLREKRKKKVIKVILILFYFLIFSFINVRVLF